VTVPAFHSLRVGRLYHPRRQHWPQGADFNARQGGHELRIFLADAMAREVEAIRSGPVEFGLLVEPLGLFLIARFSGGLSFDGSYLWHRMVEVTGERALPLLPGEMSPATRALLMVIMIEASNGLVLALRTLTFSPEFSRELNGAIHDQASSPYDRLEHQRWADGMTGRYSTDELWSRCTIRCRGGT
jgi:hypothetical protein